MSRPKGPRQAAADRHVKGRGARPALRCEIAAVLRAKTSEKVTQNVRNHFCYEKLPLSGPLTAASQSPRLMSKPLQTCATGLRRATTSWMAQLPHPPRRPLPRPTARAFRLRSGVDVADSTRARRGRPHSEAQAACNRCASARGAPKWLDCARRGFRRRVSISSETVLKRVMSGTKWRMDARASTEGGHVGPRTPMR